MHTHSVERLPRFLAESNVGVNWIAAGPVRSEHRGKQGQQESTRTAKKKKNTNQFGTIEQRSQNSMNRR